METKCPKCHFENPDDTSFCGQCGTKLSEKSLPESGPAFDETIDSDAETFGMPKEKLGEDIPSSDMVVSKRKLQTSKEITVKYRRFGIVIAALVALIFVSITVILNFREQIPATPPEKKMLVVLPFKNLGPPEDEYFADGLTEEIMSRLGALHGLGLISRTSASLYKKTMKTTRQIGEELGVDYVLEGTVRWDRSPDGKGRVRVTPQLIRVSDDTHIWSERYDEVLEDIFSVQSKIAEQVIKQLDLTVLEPERKALFAQPTDNLEAYDCYLRANEQVGLGYNNRDSDEFEQAVALLEKAVELDPGFTFAYINLSITHQFVYSLGIDRTEERLAKSRDAVDKALELDPDLPETQLALGLHYYRGFQDYERALEIFESAKKARPNIPTSYLGYIQMRQGNWEQAINNLENTFRINPRSSDLAHSLGRIYARIRKYEKSEEWFDRALSIDPDLYYSKLGKVRLPYLSKGNTSEARVLLEVLPQHMLTDYTWFELSMLERNFQEVLDRLASLSYDTFDEADFYLPLNLAYAAAYSAKNELSLMKSHADSAHISLERAIRESSEDPRFHASLGIAYAYLDRKEDAIREGNLAMSLYPVSRDAYYGPRYVLDLAKIYTVVGEYEEAINLLEYLMTIPAGNYVTVSLLQLEPVWDPLREHQRFQRLLEEHSKDENR